jgi:hypothetical protein
MREHRGQFRPCPRKKEIVMKTIDIHRYSMLVRVSDFGAAHRDLFPAAGTAGRLFAAVSKAADELRAQVATQATGQTAAREGAMSKAAARDNLRQALEGIARTARALGTPELAARFQLVGGRSDHGLTTAAHTFGEAAAPLKAEFVAHGLPKTFLDDLQAALDAFERATRDRFIARRTGAAARAGIDSTIDVALAALTRLDAIVVNMLQGKPTLLAAWASARHVTRVRGGNDHEPATAAVQGPVKAPEAGEAA